jgi:hypothetical protein
MNLPPEIKFLPWVGSEYTKGFNGRKTLILGESHYYWDESNPIAKQRRITIECIEEQIEEGYRKAFWTKLASAMIGKSPTKGDKASFWHSVAFYNYVQASAGTGPRIRPKKESWDISVSPFQIVVDELCPDIIVVLGYRLWDMLPNLSGHEGPPIEGSSASNPWFYPHKSGQAMAFSIKHPSSSFSWEEWHRIISKAYQLSKTQELNPNK